MLITVIGGADQPGLDPELPQREALVGVEADVGRRGEDHLLATGVLEHVGAQLVDHLVLDALVAGAILGREPDRVLVRHVHPRDGDGAVCVHLAGELAGQLHRAHLRAKHAPKGALDEVRDRGLDALEQVHRGDGGAARSGIGRRPSAMLRTLGQTGRAAPGRRGRTFPRGSPRARRRGGPGALHRRRPEYRGRSRRLRSPPTIRPPRRCRSRRSARARSTGAPSRRPPRAALRTAPTWSASVRSRAPRSSRSSPPMQPRGGVPEGSPSHRRSSSRGGVEQRLGEDQPPVAECPEHRPSDATRRPVRQAPGTHRRGRRGPATGRGCRPTNSLPPGRSDGRRGWRATGRAPRVRAARRRRGRPTAATRPVPLRGRSRSPGAGRSDPAARAPPVRPERAAARRARARVPARSARSLRRGLPAPPEAGRVRIARVARACACGPSA